MNILNRIFGNSGKSNSKNILDKAQKLAHQIIIKGYRNIALQRSCAPTSKTSDEQIIEIYQTIDTSFREASKKRGELLPAGYINHIVLYFLQAYETQEKSFFDEHLKYELNKYFTDGLRNDYKIDLKLF